MKKPNSEGLEFEYWWPGAESNCRHKDFQSSALPTELPGHLTTGIRTCFYLVCQTQIMNVGLNLLNSIFNFASILSCLVMFNQELYLNVFLVALLDFRLRQSDKRAALSFRQKAC